MEGKTVLLSLLILSLVTAQIQVARAQYCCPTATIVPPPVYNCHELSLEVCAKTPGCVLSTGNACPAILRNSDAAIIEYCKLGCASSVCNAINTLQISGEEVVNEAFGQCNKACSAFCTKGSTLEIA